MHTLKVTEWNKRLQPSSGVALICCFFLFSPSAHLVSTLFKERILYKETC